jgi:membrane-associated protein
VDLLSTFVDVVLHLDTHLQWLVSNYGHWVYLILFLIIFCETGLVVTPFLPGDSLLFVAGAVAAGGGMDVHALFAVLAVASFSGDNTNYWIGRFLGPRVFRGGRSKLLDPAHLERTQRFYERHGGKTIIIARFLPIFRTFAPVVAGIGKMDYRRFLRFNIFGGIGWVVSMTMLGFTLGKIYPPITKQIDKVIIIIIAVSLMPGAISYLLNRRKKSPPSTTVAM